MDGERFQSILNQYGEMGCRLLASATPKDTGKTAASWYYKINYNGNKGSSIEFYNTSMDDHGQTPVVILLQYGHGTGTGGYVQGIDFVNPTIQPTFENMAEAIWEEVCNS